MEAMQPLPKRPLGRTGHNVSVLALGGVKYNFLPDAEAAAVVSRAIDLGVNYIDTAHSYGESERKIGLVMPERRGEVYLATKSGARDRAGMAADIEESLRRLQTDRLDCVQIHDLKDEADLAKALGPDGAVKAIEEFRAAGQVRFIGVTGHRDPHVLAKALTEYPFDTILCAMGAIHEAVRPFQGVILPVARERSVGVLGMKVLAYAFLADHAERALRFVMGTEGIAAAVVGVDSIEQLEFNVRVARELTPLDQDQRADLIAKAQEIYRRRETEAWFIQK
jgi:aryl-alcohol dehydrogenase-like predicted oxidoreductase